MLKILLLCLLLTNSLLGNSHTILLENENSFFFYKENGESKGIYPKIFQDIEKKKNIKLISTELDTNLIVEIQKAEDFLIMDLVESEERRQKYYFIQTFFYLRPYIYFLNSKNEGLTNFYKKKIGIIEGTYIDKEFRDRYAYLKSELIDIETREKGVELLKNGEIEGFIADNQYGFSDSLLKIELTRIPTMVTTLAVPKTKKELYESLNDYFENISLNDLKELVRTARIEYYKDIFKDKYKNLKDNEFTVILPPEKTSYPLYYVENGEQKGITTEYLEDIEKILDIKIKKINFSEKNDWDSGDIVATSTVETGIKKGDRYINPYYVLTPVIFNRKNDGFINNLIEARTQKVAVVRESYYIDDIKPILKDENIVYVESIDEAIEKVASGQVDYGIADYKVLINKIFSFGYDKEIKVAGIFDKKYNMAMSVKSDNSELYEALKEISASFLNENLSKNIYWQQNVPEVNKYKGLVYISLVILGISLLIMYKAKKDRFDKNRYENLMLSLVSALETVNQFNDFETGNHIKRLNLYSEFLAQKLGCNKKFCEEIGKVASLHDVGKIGVDTSILKKPGKLTEEEFELMKEHSEIGYEIIKKSKISEMAENIARYHHEKWNGKGYPLGLKGKEIPLEARIVSILDVYDALRQKRVYKEGFSHEKAIEIILNESGESFDPNIVKVFMENNLRFKKVFDLNNDKE